MTYLDPESLFGVGAAVLASTATAGNSSSCLRNQRDNLNL